MKIMDQGCMFYWGVDEERGEMYYSPVAGDWRRRFDLFSFHNRCFFFFFFFVFYRIITPGFVILDVINFPLLCYIYVLVVNILRVISCDVPHPCHILQALTDTEDDRSNIEQGMECSCQWILRWIPVLAKCTV